MSVTIVMTADEAKAWAAMEKLGRSADNVEKKFGKITRATRRSGQQAQTSFGKSLASVQSYVTGMISAAAAVGLVTRGLQEMAAVRLRAAEHGMTEETARKNLLQLAGGDPAKYREYIATADKLARDYGIGVVDALLATFEGLSLGMNQAEIVSAGRFKRFSTDIHSLFEARGRLAAAFGQETLGGTADSTINAMLAGAEATRTTVSDLAGLAATPAEAMKAIGGTAKETIAAISVLSRSLGKEESSVAVGRLADVLRRDKRFKGIGLTASLEKLGGMSEGQIDRVVGENVRARRGLNLLQNMPAYMETLAKIDQAIAVSGTPASRIAGAERVGRTDPNLMAIEAKQRAEGGQQIAEREIGQQELRRQTIILATEAAAAREGKNALDRFLDISTLRFKGWLGMSPEQMALNAPGYAVPEMEAAGVHIGTTNTGHTVRFGEGTPQEILRELQATNANFNRMLHELREMQRQNPLMPRVVPISGSP